MSIYAKRCQAEQHNRRLGLVDERYGRHAERLLFGELAAALGVTPAVIRQRLRRARTRLRQKMEEDGYEF